jgi:hypothetical protein
MVIVNPEQEHRIIDSDVLKAVMSIIAKKNIIIITDFTTNSKGFLKNCETGEINLFVPKNNQGQLLSNWVELLNIISYELSLGFKLNKSGHIEWLT